ncbi:Uncharacterised protein [uncultured archaeon]|nr:Uncharacterised protein [uncultured archaeon]
MAETVKGEKETESFLGRDILDARYNKEIPRRKGVSIPLTIVAVLLALLGVAILVYIYFYAMA